MSSPGRYDPPKPNPDPYGGAGDPTPPGGLPSAAPPGGSSSAVPERYTEPVTLGPGPGPGFAPSGGTSSGVAPIDAAAPHPTAQPAGRRTRKHSRTGAAWVALVVAAIVLIFLLIFVVQNPDPVQVRYFGFEGTLALGVAMLFAAIAGALTAGLLGTVRILQLRARARNAAAPK